MNAMIDGDKQLVRETAEWFIVRQRDDRQEWELLMSLIWPLSPQLYGSEIEAWAAAAEYARRRLAKIKEVEAEIVLMNYIATVQDDDNDAEAAKRILAREQELLISLKKGVRQ